MQFAYFIYTVAVKSKPLGDLSVGLRPVSQFPIELRPPKTKMVFSPAAFRVPAVQDKLVSEKRHKHSMVVVIVNRETGKILFAFIGHAVYTLTHASGHVATELGEVVTMLCSPMPNTGHCSPTKPNSNCEREVLVGAAAIMLAVRVKFANALRMRFAAQALALVAITVAFPLLAAEVPRLEGLITTGVRKVTLAHIAVLSLVAGLAHDPCFTYKNILPQC